MTNYQVVCRTLNNDESHIISVGLIEPGGNPDKADFFQTPKQLNTLLRNNVHRCLYTTANGQTAEILPYGDDFITTTADGTVLNNLRHLRDCRGASS